MAMVPVYTMDLDLHGTPGTVTNALIAAAAGIVYSKLTLTNSIVNADIAAGAAIVDTKLAQITTANKVANSATTATAVATNDAIVARDGSGAFAASMITLSGTAVNANDVITKGYVDARLNGFDWKDSARFSTTANLVATRVGAVLTADANGTIANIDGVTPAVGNRVLVKNQTAAEDNGIYTVTSVGSGGTPYVLTRATDADANAEVTAGLSLLVTEGTLYAGTQWTLTTADPIVVNTDDLNFTQTGGNALYSAGSGLLLTGTQFSVVVDNSTIEISTNALRLKADGITNSHINSAAGIAYSKLTLTGAVVNADIASGAAIAWSKIDKTGSSLADLTTRAASALTVSAITNMTATTAQAAFAELQVNVDELYSKTGIVEGVANDYSSNTLVADSDSLKVAIGKLDAGIAALPAAKAVYSAFIYVTDGTETELLKPGGAPAIPDNEYTEFYLDGRKMLRSNGTDRNFAVEAGGAKVLFPETRPNQTIELRYWA